MPVDPWLWDSSPVPSSRPAIPIHVFRFDDPEDGSPTLTWLDNLEAIAVEQAIGIDPGRATIRYRFTGLDEEAPQSIEDALSTNSPPAPKTILVGDEIVITATKPGGTPEIIFWGEPVIYGARLGPATEGVEIMCVGKAKVAWDEPNGGQYLRDSTNIMTGDNLETDIVAQFNPKGLPNCTPLGGDADASTMPNVDNKYPCFMDPNIKDDPDHKRTFWTFPKAARYLIYRYLEKNLDTKLKLPAGAVLDALLISREPIEGEAFDPDNADTYTVKDLIAPDRPITGRDWPSVLNDMIRDKGFGMTWQTGQDDDGNPTCTLKLMLLQTGTVKDVYLQERGENFDPEKSNVGSCNIHRDINQVVNQWEVKGALEQKEASFILCPGFAMTPVDCASLAAISAFDRSEENWAENLDKYRLFVLDEAGEGHYDNTTNTSVSTPPNLNDILGAPDADTGDPKYLPRRRKPIGRLISTNSDGEPLRYSLSISTDYKDNQPDIWQDRKGTWQTIVGGYELLKDRVGIRITANSPNAWKIGKCDDANAPYPQGVVPVVESLAQVDTTNPAFWLRLTVVIEGDQAVSGIAEPTTGSVISNTITRQLDARDRYKKQTQCKSSEHFDADSYEDDQIVRDDGDDAKAEAIACRVATEAGVLEGEIVIPRFTRYYEIGDRIGKIYGRELGFRTDNGSESNENTAIYPVIVSVRHELAGGQKTFLGLSDSDGHRHKIEGKTKRR